MNLNLHGKNGIDDLEPFVHRLINPNEYVIYFNSHVFSLNRYIHVQWIMKFDLSEDWGTNIKKLIKIVL